MTHGRKSSLELCLQDRAKEPAMITAHFPPFDDLNDDDDTVYDRRRSVLEDHPAQDEPEEGEES